MLRLIALLILSAGPASAEYVHNNLRMTLYHEVAHAVIDQHDVAQFGPEETAADTFALVLADRLHTEADMRALITDATKMARSDARSSFFDAWSEYMPADQRIAYAICIYYGLNPEMRRSTALALGMPLASLRSCTDRGASVRAAWSPLLNSIAPVAPQSSLKPATVGKALRLLGRDIDRVNAHIFLPRPIPVSSESCGEENAFYFHWDERIVFCTEMVDALLSQVRGR
ncbi:DUF4344 domain-containing metallopeptidase [Jannaschia sp. 2305UL9-9]|uniref:DUF4344 domain-containing metallopeptidase n=1 Tax=Jannaschia sp. 2305UL9-9 TaxID=3121638 RepID=UPI003526E9F6